MKISRSVVAVVLIATAAVLLLSGTEVRATIIVENTLGTANLDADEYVGQSVTTPSGVGWNDILFSFLDDGTSVTYGTLFLLSSEYTGAPADLNSSVSGYIAESIGISSGASGDKYTFASSVVLSPNTKYYFYADTQFPMDDVMGGGGDKYSGGNTYWGGSTASEFFVMSTNYDLNFKLEGTPVPEPATMFLLGTGLVGLVAFRRKFKS